MYSYIPQKHEKQLTPVFITYPGEGTVPQDSKILIIRQLKVRVKGKIYSDEYNSV